MNTSHVVIHKLRRQLRGHKGKRINSTLPRPRLFSSRAALFTHQRSQSVGILSRTSDINLSNIHPTRRPLVEEEVVAIDPTTTRRLSNNPPTHSKLSASSMTSSGRKFRTKGCLERRQSTLIEW
jgi:hypothetical protein